MRARPLAIAALGLAAAGADPVGAQPPAAEAYLLHCSGCHGAEGRGVPGTVPSLHDLGWLLERPEGRAYLASVPGVAQAPLDDAALAALLDWTLQRFSGRDAGFDAAEVARHRRTPIRDTRAARARLLATFGRPPAEDAAPGDPQAIE